MAKPPGVKPNIAVMPFVAGVDRGLAVTPTYERTVWARLDGFGGNFNVFDLSSIAGPGFITMFNTGGTVPLTTNVQGSLGTHGVKILAEDFAYQLDNPEVPLAPKAKVNYFIKLWPFARAGIPPLIDSGNYPEDTQLIKAKPLKDIPKGVTQPVGTDVAIQIVNLAQGLPGHFRKLPTPTTP